MLAIRPVVVGCKEKACPIVKTFPKKLGQEDFISLGV